MKLKLLAACCLSLCLHACGSGSGSVNVQPSSSSVVAMPDFPLSSSSSLSTASVSSATESSSSSSAIARENTAYTGVRGNISAQALVEEMAPGVNLWNTLDAHCSAPAGLESETCWGNPVTTQAMITDIRNRGFKTLRIPVTWYNHMSAAPDYTIDEVWFDRVEEVANYAFANGMYVVINIHHDDYHHDKAGSWLVPTYAKQAAVTDQLEKVWTQISDRFQEYGDYLVFETMNEPREVGNKDEWTGGNAEHRDVINQYNQAAVDAIRASGGNNASRFIMVPQVGAHGVAAVESLEIPNDDERIIVSIHNYGPFDFTLKEDGTDSWGTAADVVAVQDFVKSYYDAFVSQGRAVVLGEWGAGDKDNLDDRVHYYQTVAAAVKQYGITPIAWIYSYDRATRTWKTPELEEAILEVYE